MAGGATPPHVITITTYQTMDLDLKLVSKEINEIMWRECKTLSTAESCTAGRIASVITAVPGSSNYYKGGLVCYADEVKENLLNVDAQVIEEQTPVCEEVVRQMVIGANKLFNTDYAVAISGYAGPGGPDGGKAGVIVGTIWIAVGNADNIVTRMIEEDNGRDKTSPLLLAPPCTCCLTTLKATKATQKKLLKKQHNKTRIYTTLFKAQKYFRIRLYMQQKTT